MWWNLKLVIWPIPPFCSDIDSYNFFFFGPITIRILMILNEHEFLLVVVSYRSVGLIILHDQFYWYVQSSSLVGDEHGEAMRFGQKKKRGEMVNKATLKLEWWWWWGGHETRNVGAKYIKKIYTTRDQHEKNWRLREVKRVCCACYFFSDKV